MAKAKNKVESVKLEFGSVRQKLLAELNISVTKSMVYGKKFLCTQQAKKMLSDKQKN